MVNHTCILWADHQQLGTVPTAAVTIITASPGPGTPCTLPTAATSASSTMMNPREWFID